MKKVKCHYCEGLGQSMNWADDMFGNTMSFWETCESCDGYGEVTEAENELIKEIFPEPNRYYREKYEKNI